MTESANLQNDVPPGAPVPAASLESILRTQELRNRPSRSPDYEKENLALVSLANALAESPGTILQTLVDKVFELLRADSAGLSLLTKDEKRFYWAAIAGAWRPHAGANVPRNSCPCGDVLDHNIPMLFTHWERRYENFSRTVPIVEEGLFVPFYVNGKAVGTIWAFAHDNRRKFDAEDLRLLERTSRFASAAYQVVESIENLKLEIAAREKAEAAARELANGLETQVRVRTQDLERSTRDLLDANKALEREIVERQRTSEVLRVRELNLRLLIDSIPAPVAVMTPGGEVESVNQPTLQYFGKTFEELKKWGTSDAVHPDDLPRAIEVWMEAIKTGQPYDIKERLRRFDGVYRWFEVRGFPLRDPDRVILNWCVLLTDVDDRQRAEEALRASELSWRQIVDSIPGLVATLNASGEVEFINRQILEYFGKPSTELKNWARIGAIHPDDLPRVIEAHNNAIKGGQTYESVHRLRRADGEFRWFQVRGLPVRDSQGPGSGWYLLLTDIDDRKQAEEKLLRSEAFLSEAQRVSLTGSFSFRLATDEVTFSEEMCRIFELVPPVSLEMIRSRIHPQDLPVFRENLERTRRGDPHDIENDLRLLLPDGSVKIIHIVAHLTRDQSGEQESIGTVQDVTQRRLSEEAVAKARTELANMARVTSMGMLTASIAHEINQPLFGIITNAGTCLSMLSADPPDIDGARETTRRTIRDGNRASDVITRLRTLYSKKDPSPESMNLNDATREVISLSLGDLQRQRVIVRLELADDLPLITADRVQLQQVIMNFVRNALDAMSNVDDRPRELLIRTEREGGDRVRLSVRDAGVGFEPQAANRLFEAFYTTKTEGMGIGLSISRSIIEAHQGRLWATANDGPGATFSFSIPCITGTLAAESNGSQPDHRTDAA